MSDIFWMTGDVYRRGVKVLTGCRISENNGTGVGVSRKDTTPDVERQTLHYFKGNVDVRLGDMLVIGGQTYRLGSPYNCRGHHIEVTSERIGDMVTATLKRRVRDQFNTPTGAIAGQWEISGIMGSKRHREETVGGTGKAVKPIKTFTALSLPPGLEKPEDDDILTVRGDDYTVIISNEAVMNADVGLWTIALVEGAI